MVCLLAFPLYRWGNWAQGGEWYAQGDRISNKEGGCKIHAIHLSLCSSPSEFHSFPALEKASLWGEAQAGVQGRGQLSICHIKPTVKMV